MLNLLIFGPPGAGKGTQAALIAKKYKLTHLSSGDILRAELKNGESGAKLKKILEVGKLVPDKLIIAMMETAVINDSNKNGFIFDGYPRTIKQAKSLDKFLKTHGLAIDKVLNLKLSEREASKRILERGKTSGRSDDNAKIVKARFNVYRAQTQPLLDYYKLQGKKIDIDGRPSVEEVFQAINERLQK